MLVHWDIMSEQSIWGVEASIWTRREPLYCTTEGYKSKLFVRAVRYQGIVPNRTIADICRPVITNNHYASAFVLILSWHDLHNKGYKGNFGLY